WTTTSSTGSTRSCRPGRTSGRSTRPTGPRPSPRRRCAAGRWRSAGRPDPARGRPRRRSVRHRGRRARRGWSARGWSMLLAEVAATSDAVAATRSRLAKRAAIADLLRRVADDDAHDEIEIAVAYLAGELRQRRTGLGWRSLRDLPSPAQAPSLTLTDVDAAFARMAGLSGPGSATARQAEAATLFGAATAREQALLAGLVSGELRQGAPDSVVVDRSEERRVGKDRKAGRSVNMRKMTPRDRKTSRGKTQI